MAMRYQHHIFICTNEREDGDCCAKRGSFALLKAMKAELRERNLDHDGGIMATKAGCFGKCGEGPNVVVYPRGSWHVVQNADDAAQLIDELQMAS
jgi:(2Fe-2S) ferredoxin